MSAHPTRAPSATRCWLTGLLVLFAALGVVYSVVVPVFEASDELWHYPMVEVIARTWQLPIQPLEPGTVSGPWRQEGSQPPLYYALGAALTFWIDTSDLDTARQPNPHARAGEITPERDNVSLVVHNPANESFPWSGTVLAVHVVRLFSVLLGTWAIYLTWMLVRELYPDPPWIALVAAAVHGFTPMYLFISSSVNNDNLIVPLSTLALLQMVRLVKKGGEAPTGATTRDHAILGCIIGLALLTKASGIALLVLAAAALAWEAWRLPAPYSWAQRVTFFAGHATALAAPAALIAGWWFARNIRLYGDLLGFNAFYAVLGTRDVAADLAQLWAERQAFAAGYWGNFGGLNVPMPNSIYAGLNWLAIAATAGLVARLVWFLAKPTTGRLVEKLWPFAWSNQTAARALAWAFPAGVFVSWIRWATVTWSSQGRLIFTAIAMWSAALVLGLSAYIPARLKAYQLLPSAALGAGLVVLSVLAPALWIAPAYAPPPATASGAEAHGLTPLDRRFGDDLELLGYAVDAEHSRPGGTIRVRLMWRALGPTPSYRSIFIHVLGEGDRIVAQRDTFPGHGLLPTTQLASGQTWEEHHILTIPPTAYTPDALVLAVGVYETATGARILPKDSQPGDDRVRFGHIALTSEGHAEGTPVSVHFGSGIELTGYDLSAVVVAPGEVVTVTLEWLCTAPIGNDYTISVQVIDEQWRKAAQSDTWPLEGQAPTSTWKTGQRIFEERALAIAADVEPGAYDLQISIYHAGAGGELVHLPISLGDAGMPAKSIVLTRLRVR